MFTARVPGFGLVEWSTAQVKDYAGDIRRVHVARHRLFHLPVFLRGDATCNACGEAWPCPPAVWAAAYGSSTGASAGKERRR